MEERVEVVEGVGSAELLIFRDARTTRANSPRRSELLRPSWC